jgi:hypothetical protein
VEAPIAGIGRLGLGEAWVGIQRTPNGFRLVFGDTDTALRISDAMSEQQTDELLVAAIAYFEEALDAPPPELEATQADLGELVRWLTRREPEGLRRRALAEALDAIDDGLAGDIVVARLAEARGQSDQIPNEQADVVDLLVSRYEALSAPGQ